MAHECHGAPTHLPALVLSSPLSLQPGGAAQGFRQCSQPHTSHVFYFEPQSQCLSPGCFLMLSSSMPTPTLRHRHLQVFNCSWIALIRCFRGPWTFLSRGMQKTGINSQCQSCAGLCFSCTHTAARAWVCLHHPWVSPVL